MNRLDEGMRRWIIKTARSNFWRMPAWFDLDDLIQEGLMAYAKCSKHYADVVDQKHFMALVKVTYLNRIHDLAKSRTPLEHTAEPSSPVFNRATPEEATFAVLYGQLPDDLRKLIQRLLDEPVVNGMRLPGGRREDDNQVLCRMLGLDSRVVNVPAIFKEHFRNSN